MSGRWLAAVLMGGTVASTAMITMAADADAQAREPWAAHRRGDGYTYYEKRRTNRPEHGYEGFAGPPLRRSFCSYRRIPERQCGPKGCRVTGWTLEQWCQ